MRLRPELVGLVAIAGTLNLWALSRNGWANDYYSAAVRSMSSSWHDFLFASLDKSGVMTVGSRVRVSPAERARAAGADGGGERGARV